jgi:hypothetical protein
MISSILLFPFIYNNTSIVAILFISESPLLTKSREYIEELFENLHENITPLLYSSREEKASKLSYPVSINNKDVLENGLNDLLENASATEKHGIIIIISIQALVDHIMNSISEADSYRIRQDILKVLSSMVPDNGKIITIDNERVLLGFTAKKVSYEKLIMHQLSLSLKQFFYELGQAPVLDYRVRIYPQDGEDPKTLLEGIVDF